MESISNGRLLTDEDMRILSARFRSKKDLYDYLASQGKTSVRMLTGSF